MFAAAKRNLFCASLFALIALASLSVKADGVGRELRQRTQLQAAEIKLLQAQLDLESWKLVQVKDVYSKGYASWLKLQNQQLEVEAARVRVDSANEFQEFLGDIAIARAARQDNLVALRDRTSKPVKVFIPGSVRLIGWIELPTTARLNFDDTGQQLRAVQEQLTKAQRRLTAVIDSPAAGSDQQQLARLQLDLAKSEFEHTKLFLESYSQPSIEAHELSISLQDQKQFVTAADNLELAAATANVASAESAATGQIELAKSMLKREQQRLETLRERQLRGAASPQYIEMETSRVAAIQSRLDAYIDNRDIFRQAATAHPSTEPAPTVYQPVYSWPSVVLRDSEYMLHLIDLRQKYHEVQATRKIAEVRLSLLTQVLPRLKRAALSQESIKNQFQSTLRLGQLNEITSYESEIEVIEAAEVSAEETQQILVREEARFIVQATTQYEAARDSLAAAEEGSAAAVGMLGLITSPVGMLLGTELKAVAPRYSYFESGVRFDWKSSQSLVVSFQGVDFVASPLTAESLDRIRLQPARDRVLAQDSMRSDLTPSGMAWEPDWMNSFRHNYAWNTNSESRNGKRAVIRDYPSPNYGLGNNRSFETPSAYPYGILRTELRSRITPGQTPWYLPGSPSNY